MKAKSLLKLFVPAIAVTMGVSSCQDYDADFSKEAMLKHEYAENFEKIFGKADPNQDWSAASQIKANIDLSCVNGNCIVTVYNSAPTNNNSAILYRSNVVGGGKLDILFDAPKTNKEVYVVVKNENGLTPISNYFGIENGEMKAKANMRGTRADFPVTIGAQISPEKMGKYSAYGERSVEANSRNPQYCTVLDGNGQYTQHSKSLNELFAAGRLSLPCYVEGAAKGTFIVYTNEGGTLTPHNIAKTEWSSISATYNASNYYRTDNDGYWMQDYGNPFHYEYGDYPTDYAETYLLNGVTTTDGASVYISDIYPIVGVGGVFNERAHADTDPRWCNLAKWYKDLNAEAGAEYIIEKGGSPVEFDYFYGGTQHKNQLGYFYYRDGESYEEAIKHPHYIIAQDARPRANVKVDNVLTPEADGMSLPGLVTAYGSNHSANPKLTATHYKLVYFGEDGKGSGDYTFPEGTHVVLFLVNNGMSTIGVGSYGAGIENSVPAFNYIEQKRVENKTLNTWHGHDHDSDYENKTLNCGELDAVTYSWGGTIILGFEDRDEYDMNDVLLFIKGNFKNTHEIKELKEKDEDVYEWMVACEDLGGTDDYDFNDVVFGVKKYDSKTTLFKQFYENGTLVSTTPAQVTSDHYLMVTPYAAGATLKSNIKNTKYFDEKEFAETHTLISGKDYSDVLPGDMPVLNAGSSKGTPGTPVVISLTEVQANAFSINDAGFSIKVTEKDGSTITVSQPTTEYNKESDNTPQMLILPQGWTWPRERNIITLGYPNFEFWVQDEDRNTDWYKYPDVQYLVATPNIVDVPSADEEEGPTGPITPVTPPTEPEITPSGTTTYTGTALEALKSNNTYVIPANVCQTKTACTVTLTYHPNDQGFVQLNALTYDDDINNPTALFASPNWGATYQLNSIESKTEYSYPVNSSAFNLINKNGMRFSTDYGSITSIKIVAQ